MVNLLIFSILLKFFSNFNNMKAFNLHQELESRSIIFFFFCKEMFIYFFLNKDAMYFPLRLRYGARRRPNATQIGVQNFFLIFSLWHTFSLSVIILNKTAAYSDGYRNIIIINIFTIDVITVFKCNMVIFYINTTSYSESFSKITIVIWNPTRQQHHYKI